VFGGDKDKTRLLLQLYNSTNSVSADIPASLRTMAKTNLRGEFIKMLMITQSGAEGISLKCVRRVLIMEPFWNMVRIDQVIGRAVRAHSHNALPEDERNVTVSIYTTVFTPKMAKDFTMENKDNSMTTDTHILSIAEKKDGIIQVFLNQLKIAAVDCRSLAKINEPRENGLSCYAFPVPVKSDEFAYHAYLSHDLAQEKNTNRLVRDKPIQGRVVVKKGQQKKYVQVPDYPDQLFDYDAYLQAGVLVPT
jgi:superfamily II DNA or RNA helicase